MLVSFPSVHLSVTSKQTDRLKIIKGDIGDRLTLNQIHRQTTLWSRIRCFTFPFHIEPDQVLVTQTLRKVPPEVSEKLRLPHSTCWCPCGELSSQRQTTFLRNNFCSKITEWYSCMNQVKSGLVCHAQAWYNFWRAKTILSRVKWIVGERTAIIIDSHCHT